MKTKLAIIVATTTVILHAAQWSIAPDGATGLEILKDDAVVARVSVHSWGPAWAYFGFKGQAVVDSNDVRLAQLTGSVGGTKQPLDLAFSARKIDQRSLAVECNFSAPEGATLVGVALVIEPIADHYRGGTAIVRAADNSMTTCTPVFALGELNEPRGSCVALRNSSGEELSFTIEPERAIASDRAARIWLLRNEIHTGETVSTRVVISTPGPLKFYASDAASAVRHVTDEWFDYSHGAVGPPVDLSFLNKDADGNWVPAGVHGFLKVKGDQLAFADGTPARLWGLNVTAYAVMSTPERAAQIAERLARMGCNVARLHHIDSTWGPCIIDRKHPDNTTQHLDMPDLQRLDRLVFELKQRGIYVMLDPWVGREYLAGDNVPGWDQMGGGNFGLHPYIFFDPQMQALHKQFLRQIWLHTNEYTGLAYKDEPAIATTELCNEALFNNGKIGKIEHFRTEFVAQYEAWAAKNGAPTNVGDKVWQLNYPRDNQRFYLHVMREFYRTFREFNRRELGLKIPFNASNWAHWPWVLASQTECDFMEAHQYYGGDRIGAGAGVGGLWVQHPPTLPNGPFSKMGQMFVAGQPSSISEFGNNPPKTYRAAYYPGLAAVACLNEWDILTGFAFTQGGSPAKNLSPYEWESDPATVASYAAGALIFRRGDVRPARHLAVMLVDSNEQFAMHYQNDGERMYENTPQFNVCLETHKTVVCLGKRVPEELEPAIVMTPASAFTNRPTGTTVTSDTGELWRDWQAGVGLINTPRTQAAYGMLGASGKIWKTDDCSFEISTPYATLVLSSLTDADVAHSTNLLLTAVARVEMTGQAYNRSQTKIINAGAAPVMAEPVCGRVLLSTSASNLVMRAVRADGSSTEPEPLTIENGVATIPLNAAHKTLYYLIQN